MEDGIEDLYEPMVETMGTMWFNRVESTTFRHNKEPGGGGTCL